MKGPPDMIQDGSVGRAPAPPAVTVTALREALRAELGLQILEGESSLGNEIRSSRIQKLGLTLAGLPSYVHPGRVQIFGSSELAYLEAMEAEARARAADTLRGPRIACIVVTKGLEPPRELRKVAREQSIPLLRTDLLSSECIGRITKFLESRLARRTTVHGVMLEVSGVGVLLLGPSGAGKSECALELVLKGHRLIADDAVDITREGLGGLVARPGAVLRYHMELRGLGIIDIKELFGISATGSEQRLDLAVKLERWQPEDDHERLGVEHASVEFLGVRIPLVRMPVAPGRNVATLVEVAVRVHLLRERGLHPSKELRAMAGPTPAGPAKAELPS